MFEKDVVKMFVLRDKIKDLAELQKKIAPLKKDRLEHHAIIHRLKFEEVVSTTADTARAAREKAEAELAELRQRQALARELGGGITPQEVGAAVGLNPVCILIPCHRVVGKDGGLVGYGGGLAKKRWLLDHELRTAGVVLR